MLGRAYPSVDRIIDGPYKVLGNRHRAYFHDPLSLLAMFGGNRKRLEAALLHLMVDEVASARPEVKAAFEMLGARRR